MLDVGPKYTMSYYSLTKYVFIFIFISTNVSRGEGNVTEEVNLHLLDKPSFVQPNMDMELTKFSLYEHAGNKEDEEHDCVRKCSPNVLPKSCYYNFTLEWYLVMSKACYDCPHNLRDCTRPHCVPADGFRRPITIVNRRLPGPKIQVCEGDEIIVDVNNHLVTDSTTIHWHGLHQRGTPYMDGVPQLTQCPISPGSTFRYHFLADNPGTHYWHSHSGYQRADGVFGPIVITSKEDDHISLYDVDDPKHTLLITDWMDALAIDKFVNHHHDQHDNKPYNLLVNGLGKFEPLVKSGKSAYSPIPEFRVQKGLKYRFRTISNSIQNCPIEISVDNHTLLVIATDGQNIVPVTVESLVIYAGERWDFILNANQEERNYWMKFRGLLDCDDRFLSAYQVALVRYGNKTEIPQPLDHLKYDSMRRQGLQLNTLNEAPGDMKTFLTAADVRHAPKNGIQEKHFGKEPNYKFWLDFDFYDKNNYLFHHEDLYSFFGVDSTRRVYLPQINNISFRLPSSPPLSQPESLDTTSLCNSTTHTDCADKFCYCIHTLEVELNSLVELILVDKGIVYYANHPFHLHGNTFAVVGMGKLGEETTLEQVLELEKNGKLLRNFDNPPIKDSVTVPDGGFTIIRFYADNPGYWLFHCHLTFHVEVGMALVFHIGDQSHLPPVPDDFPKCGSWTPPPDSLKLNQQIREWKRRLVNVENENSKADIAKGDSGFYLQKCSLCLVLMTNIIILGLI